MWGCDKSMLVEEKVPKTRSNPNPKQNRSDRSVCHWHTGAKKDASHAESLLPAQGPNSTTRKNQSPPSNFSTCARKGIIRCSLSMGSASLTITTTFFMPIYCFKPMPLALPNLHRSRAFEQACRVLPAEKEHCVGDFMGKTLNVL